MATIPAERESSGSIGDRLLAAGLRVDLETLAYVAIMVVAVFTRFHDLGTRVMSHDESLHTYFSWQLAEQGNFQHSPLMHGPLQFHLIALSYFLFGATDATARFPAALASVLAIGLLIPFRRWLGKAGALTAAALMTVSPYMLYYGRYVRNEALVVAIGILTFYAVFRYFEDRQARWLYLLTASLALHFTAKETAFIYTAQLMLFLGLLLSWRFLQARWDRPSMRIAFLLGLILVLVAVVVGGAGIYADSQLLPAEGAETVEPADPTGGGLTLQVGFHPAVTVSLIMMLVGGLLAAGAAVWSFGTRLRTEFPAFDVLLVATTVTLPQLAAFPANMLGWDPLAYQDTLARLNTGIVIAILMVIAVAMGVAWDYRRWLIAAGVFFGVFAFFYTTVLTHPSGFFTGLVGSLGYWLEQHGVNRGSQPLYYYLLIQIPIYEFLPALGAILAGVFGLQRWLAAEDGEKGEGERSVAHGEAEPAKPVEARRFPVLLFLGFWALSATAAYTIAGERMPWLTVHIALPYILLAGWSFGKVLAGVDWRAFLQKRGWALLLLGLIGLLALARAAGYLLGAEPPFAGSELDQLRTTSGFLISTGITVAAFIALVYLASGWRWPEVGRLAGVAAILILFVLTARASFRAAFINYDRAQEFLVYAHSARGVKTVLEQVEELSLRTSDGMGIDVGYDDDVSWPYSWYLRNFTSNHYFAANPTRDLLNYPVIIVGDNNWSQVEPILGDRYYTFEHIRMWWPMQDYFDLTWERVWGALSSPQHRAALWEIWFDREYDRYGQLKDKDFSLENWSPSDRMRLYVRKDIAATIWDYGVVPQTLEEAAFTDPYEDGSIELTAERIVGDKGAGLGQFESPRGMAIGAAGSLIVADSGNHRIVKLDREGQAVEAWGAFGSGGAGEGLQLNEPWGVAAAPDGSIYVADTWNHRVHHLSAEGDLLETFGSYGEAQDLQSFWGPRDVVVDNEGRIFVADTGNKRVVYFDAPGRPAGSFGGAGVGPGQLDEPVGLAVSPQGRVYVADTWNQRVQAFEENAAGEFVPVVEWSISGWYGQSLDNKPYLSVSPEGSVCLSDPEGYRVLCFDEGGEFLASWGDLGTGPGQFGLPVGLAFNDRSLWIVDKGNNRLMEFVPPIP